MRYVDADKLQEEFKELHGGKRSLLIDTEPTADVRENIKGEWIRRDSRYVGWISFNCSVCGETLELDRETSSDFKYCPFCGADMRGEA